MHIDADGHLSLLPPRQVWAPAPQPPQPGFLIPPSRDAGQRPKCVSVSSFCSAVRLALPLAGYSPHCHSGVPACGSPLAQTPAGPSDRALGPEVVKGLPLEVTSALGALPW